VGAALLEHGCQRQTARIGPDWQGCWTRAPPVTRARAVCGCVSVCTRASVHADAVGSATCNTHRLAGRPLLLAAPTITVIFFVQFRHNVAPHHAPNALRLRLCHWWSPRAASRAETVERRLAG
jgi:hypothetical protein